MDKTLTLYKPFEDLLDAGKFFAPFLAGEKEIIKGFEGFGDKKFFSPEIRIEDKKDRVVVRTEIPGAEEKDFTVSLKKDHLLISGEKKKDKEVKEKNYYYSESNYASFCRAVPLTTGLDRDKVKTTFKGGVLTVELPKKGQK